MAFSTIPKMRKDGTLTLLDNAGANTLEIQYEDGNFTFTPTKRQQLVLRDRGVITTVRQSDADPAATGSFSVHFRQFTDSGVGGVIDFVNKTGGYASNVSTGSSGTPYIEEYCIDIKYEVDGSAVGDDNSTYTATISKCICNISFTEGDASQVNIEFTAYGSVSYTTTA
jgi:hypothetical protein